MNAVGDVEFCCAFAENNTDETFSSIFLNFEHLSRVKTTIKVAPLKNLKIWRINELLISGVLLHLFADSLKSVFWQRL